MQYTDDHIFDWVSRIIDNCTHDFHFDAVDRLIDLYYERVKDEPKYLELKLMKKVKWDEIHNILS